jgi:hypothetical protein
MTMAAVATTSTKRFTNIIEYVGATVTAENDWFQAPSYAGDVTFVATVTGDTSIDITLEGGLSDGTTWFPLDEEVTITAPGTYSYSYSNTPTTLVRLRVSGVTAPDLEADPAEVATVIAPAIIIGHQS